MKKIFYVILISSLIYGIMNIPFSSGFYDKYFSRNTIDYKLKLIDNMPKAPDIVFFGPSNSEFGLNAKLIEDEYSKYSNKEVTAFNMSIPAATYLDKVYLLKYLVKIGKKPKLIVLHYVPKTELTYTDTIYYASYFTLDKAMSLPDLYDLSQSTVNKKSLAEFYFAYFYKPYLYRGVLSDQIKETYSNFKQGNDLEINFAGQVARYTIRGDLESKLVASEAKVDEPLLKNASKLIKDFYLKKITVNENHMHAFNKIIEYAKKENIRVLIVNLPEIVDFSYNGINGKFIDYILNENVQIYKNYAERKNVFFIDLINKNRFNVFDSVDGLHLTYETSKALSRSLAKKLYENQEINSIFSDNTAPNHTKSYDTDAVKRDLIHEKDPFKKYYILQRCIDNKIYLEKKLVIDLIKEDNDYLSLLAMDYLFKFFSNDEIYTFIVEELNRHKNGGWYSISRYEAIFNHMQTNNLYIKDKDLNVIPNFTFDEYLRLNAVLSYLTSVNLPNKEFVKNYIDSNLNSLESNKIENMSIVIKLSKLIDAHGDKTHKLRFKQILKDKNLKLLLEKIEDHYFDKKDLK